jgi:hypothetical protein
MSAWEKEMTTKAWDTSAPPIYGCLTGIELPNEMIAILPGIALRRVYVDTFGATMMAFAPPSTPKSILHRGLVLTVASPLRVESKSSLLT